MGKRLSVHVKDPVLYSSLGFYVNDFYFIGNLCLACAFVLQAIHVRKGRHL